MTAFDAPAKASPGALNVYANVTGVQHLLTSILPIVMQEAVAGQTFDADVHISKWDYTLDVSNITVAKVTGPSIKVFDQTPEDFHIFHFDMGGIDASLDVQCTFKALHLIPITVVGVDIKNFVLDGRLQFDAEDPVHW